MSEVLNRILEYTLGTPGTYVDTPEFKADAKAAADRAIEKIAEDRNRPNTCLLYTSPSPRDRTRSRMPSSA